VERKEIRADVQTGGKDNNDALFLFPEKNQVLSLNASVLQNVSQGSEIAKVVIMTSAVLYGL
jgi:hypothetical protein